jgi:ribosomal protein S18 acetylase RimI-like enzyme
MEHAVTQLASQIQPQERLAPSPSLADWPSPSLFGDVRGREKWGGLSQGNEAEPSSRSMIFNTVESSSAMAVSGVAEARSNEAHQSEIVGCAVVSILAPEAMLPPPFPSAAPLRCCISNLAISPAHRKKGLATMIVKQCETIGSSPLVPRLPLPFQISKCSSGTTPKCCRTHPTCAIIFICTSVEIKREDEERDVRLLLTHTSAESLVLLCPRLFSRNFRHINLDPELEYILSMLPQYLYIP